jgi:hypothetical protein
VHGVFGNQNGNAYKRPQQSNVVFDGAGRDGEEPVSGEGGEKGEKGGRGLRGWVQCGEY